MPTIQFNATSFSATLLCLTSMLSSGCHNDIKTEASASATADKDWFDTDTSSPTDEPTTAAGDPTDGGGDPTDGGIHPPDFCTLHPVDDYPGFVYVCSGSVRGGINFDYFGDPDLPLDKYIPCIDMSEVVEKPAGYVYSCFIEIGDYPFGPDVTQPNGHQIDACCLRDSPSEAAGEFCRIDGAEEFCVGASDGLNAFRAEIPHIPLLAEVNQQLENLNKFLAKAATQTDCSTSIAKGLLEAGNFDSDHAEAGWQLQHPQELDPEVGWPWFRELRMNVYGFQIDDVENSGLACNQRTEDALTEGVIQGAQLSIVGEMGAAMVDTTGRFGVRTSDCRLASCEFTLDDFELEVKGFSVGSLTFSDVSVSLAEPAVGLLQGDVLAIPENHMHLTASFQLIAEGRPVFEGAPVSVGLRNHGGAHFQMRPDSSLAVKKLDVVHWPFEIALVSQVSP